MGGIIAYNKTYLLWGKEESLLIDETPVERIYDHWILSGETLTNNQGDLKESLFFKWF